jgi:CHAT domain-containing protein/tetratricopeptide (TPR) repeat protein
MGSIGFSRALPLVMLAATILTMATPTVGSSPAAAPTPLVVRLAAWSRGVELMDAGRNAEAAAYYAELLQMSSGRLEAAEWYYQASARLCRPDSALILLSRNAPGTRYTSAYLHFLEAARLRRTYRYTEAGREFALAADHCTESGDSLSAAIAQLEVARCRLRIEDLEGAEASCAQVEALLAETPSAARLLAEASLLRAGIHNLAGRLVEADSIYAGLLSLGAERGWRQVKGDVLNGLGAALSKRRRIQEALDHYRRALSESRVLGDPYRLTLTLTNLAYEETQARELAPARRHLEEARRTAEGCDLIQLLGLVFNGLGAVADGQGDRPQAADYFRLACDHNSRTGYARGELASRQRLAYDLLQMGEYREAVQHYERCLEIMEELPSTYILNWVLAGLAVTQHYLGNLDQAESYYRRALAVNEEMGDRMSASWCLNSIGLVYALRGDYRGALVQHHRAREIYREIGDIEGEGEAEASIAEVLYHLGDYERARGHGEQAMALAEQSGSEELLRTAAAALASIYGAAGRPDLAEAHHRQALDIARRWRDNIATIWALDELAAHELAQGRRATARQLLDEAADKLAARGEYPVRAQTLLLLSRNEEDPARAAAFAEQALAVAQEGCLPEMEWQSLSELGVRALALGDTARAELSQRQALDVIESLRRNVGVDELRRHMLRPALQPYERLVDLLLARDLEGPAATRALIVSERVRAQILASRLRAAYAHAGGAAEPARAAEEQDLLSRLAHLQALLQDGSLEPDERHALRAKVDDLEREFGLLQLRLAGSDGGQATELYPEVELPDTLLAALRPGERLLSWFLGEQASYLFSAADGRVRAFRLPPREEIESEVLLFLQLWQGETAAALPPELLETAAQELYDLLLGPAAAELRPGEILVLVPDGLLHRLPFALLRGDRGYLIEEHELFLTPSLRTLRYLRARSRERLHEGVKPRLSLLAIGCEGGADQLEGDQAAVQDSLGGEKVSPGGGGAGGETVALRRVLPFTGAPVPRLPYAAAEALEVAALFPDAVVFTGTEANEASFKRGPVAEAQVLHVAAHGHADATDVRRSFLVLNPGAPLDDGPDLTSPVSPGEASAAAEDGLLQWHEVVGLPLYASLVTLASCRSAGGVLARGEGVIGLTQAFLHAGATSVLAAQADVPDRFARRLMLGFYHELRAGRTAAEALRAVQLQALAWEDAGAGRAAWAGFVLVGDGSVTLTLPGRAHPLLLLAGILVAVMVILMALRLRRSRFPQTPRS